MMKAIIASGVTPPSMSKAAPLAPASMMSVSAVRPQPADCVFSPPKVSQKYLVRVRVRVRIGVR